MSFCDNVDHWRNVAWQWISLSWQWICIQAQGLKPAIDWIGSIDWEHVAKIAPVATACIAFIAATIAWRSLHNQKVLALKKSAIDFFLKVELDATMIKEYDAYKQGIVELKKSIGDDPIKEYDLAYFQEADTVHYNAITRYLDVIELMATAITSGAFDNKVCFSLWSHILSDVVRDAKFVIDNERKGDKHLPYDELLTLERKWRRRLKKARRGLSR